MPNHHIFVIIFMIALVTFICYLLYARHIVKTKSPCLLMLRQINSQYNFLKISPQFVYYIELTSKQNFDRYNCDTLFQQKLADCYEAWAAIRQQLDANNLLFDRYTADVLKSCTHGTIPRHCFIFRSLWNKYENRMFKKEKLKPVTRSNIICVARYTSPKGRNHYRKQASYSFDEIDSRYSELKKEIEKKSTEEYRRKQERSKMSPSLRYDILKRDHFRCQICGRSASDDVTLEVDHIIPISKGGKTVPDNLRTLCKDCNRGKRDKFE